MKKLIVLLLVLLLPTVWLFSGCVQTQQKPPNIEDQPSSPEEPLIPQKPEPEPEPEPRLLSATLLAAGDNLIHNSIYLQAEKRACPGNYDFLPVYHEVKDYISDADIAFINQETLLASDACEVSSYPSFCSPTQLGDQLISLGFDVFTHSNNHVFDKGEKGALAAIAYWAKQPDAIQTGLFKDIKDRETVRIVERNGIKFAFIAFATATNGYTMPKDSTVNIIVADDYPAVKKQVELAKKVADVVVASVHWGNENQKNPSPKQTEIAQHLADFGVDVILGSHPHVLQPITELDRPDGSKTLMIYSLGNFVSHQQGAANMIGGFLNVTVTMEEDTHAISTEAEFIPTITQYEQGGKNIRIIPYVNYTSQLADSHGVNAKEKFTYEFIESYLNEVIGSQYLSVK